MYIAYVGTKLQIFVDLRFYVGTSRDALVLCIDDHTIVAQEAHGSVVLCLVRTA